MALFGKKKNKEEEVVVDAEESADVDTTVILDKETANANVDAVAVDNGAVKAKKPYKAPRIVTVKPKRHNIVKTTARNGLDLSSVIKSAHITEKAAIIAGDANAYTFNVDVRANKVQIKQAIESIYKVSPVKIRVAKIMDKKVRVRGQRKKSGIKSGGKKAYVYLKKGDKIEFV